MPSWRAIFNAATILYVLAVIAWGAVTGYGVATGAIPLDKLSDRLWEIVLLFQGVVILFMREASAKATE